PRLFIRRLLPGVRLHSIERRAVDEFPDRIGKTDFSAIFPADFRNLCRTGFRNSFLTGFPDLPSVSSSAVSAPLLSELQDRPFILRIPCRGGMKRFPLPKVLKMFCC